MRPTRKCELRAMEERTANYPGYRDESTMEVIRHESLGIYIYAKPKERAAKNVQSGYAEQGRGYPLYPCPVAYQ